MPKAKSSYENITLEIEGRIATLTLNQPDSRNALGPGMIDEIVDACHAVQKNAQLSVLILTGAGKAFCAGGNVKNMKTRAESSGSPIEVPISYREGIQRIPRMIDSMDVPTIAAVNGAAVGAGCDLAMFCDMRIASTSAKFGEVFLDLGIVPGDGGPWFLTREIGYSRAAEMTFTARMVDAQEALKMGMVLKVVEPEQLMPATMELAETIAAKSPATLRMTKRLLKEATRLSLWDYLDSTGAYQGLARSTEDYKEGILARNEKRKPVFRGR